MASPTKLISTSQGFQDAQGNVVANGLLMLQLTQNATVTATGGQVDTAPIYFTLDVNGKITSSAIWFNDELSPSGTAYHAILYSQNGARILTDFGNWVIAGASVDLSTIVASTTTVSYANVVLTNPAGNQTISNGNLSLSSGFFQAPNGSAAAPSYEFGNSTNSGLYLSNPATGEQSISVNGTQRFIFGAGVETINAGSPAMLLQGNTNPSYQFGNPRDTSLTRTSAGIVTVDTGTLGNFAGTLKLAAIIASKTNNLIWLDGSTFTTLAGAYAALPAGGGIVIVPPNYSETLSANLTLNKNNSGFMFTGPATITLGTNQVIISAGTFGVSIDGYIQQGGFTSVAPTSSGVRWIYTGTTTPFAVGSTTDTKRVLLRNFYIDLTGAGSAAIGLTMTGVQESFLIDGLIINGVGGTNTQIGIQCNNGTGALAYTGDGLFQNIAIGQTKIGVQTNGTTEENQWIGVNITSPTAAGTIGWDFEGSTFSQMVMTTVSNAVTAVNYGASAQGNYVLLSANSGSAYTDVAHAAGTSVNFTRIANSTVAPGNVPPVITDSGTNNTVIGGGIIYGPNTLINQQGPLTAVTGNGTDQTLYTFTIPANRIRPGKGFRLKSAFSATGANATIKIVIGATTFTTQTQTAGVGDSVTLEVFNNAGVQNAQNAYELYIDGSSITVNSGGTLTENFANAVTVKITANQTNPNTVTPRFWLIESIQ